MSDVVMLASDAINGPSKTQEPTIFSWKNDPRGILYIKEFQESFH